MPDQFETQRLLLREIQLSDNIDMYEMDSNPEVHRFLGNKPRTELAQTTRDIEQLREQYLKNGIGRWAVIEKVSKQFIGWSGLKFYTEELNQHINFYELGYRFKQAYWGKGYATESAQFWVDYGFTELGLQEMFAIAEQVHHASKNVLTKLGFQNIETFDWDGDAVDWFKITRKG